MPLVAPTDTTITLYAAKSSVGLNGSVELTATVIESAGTPVQNGTVVNFTTTLGTIDPLDARTQNGRVTVTLWAGTVSGTAEVRALSGGSAVKDPVKIAVGAAAASRVDLLANPTALPAAGGTAQLTAIVSDASGNRLAGVPVSFATDTGTLSQTSPTSDGNGEARSSLTTTAKASLTATVVGGTSGFVKSDTLVIPVRQGPTITLTPPSASLVPGTAGSFTVKIDAGTATVRTAVIDFGDGTTQSLTTSGTSTLWHAYQSSGTYVVTVAAIDTAGEVTTASAAVSVQSVTVSVTLTVPASVNTSTPASFTATATVTPTGTAIERFEWSFGDGAIRTTSGGSTTHLYATKQTFVVTVTAYTASGAKGSAQSEIVVQ
jgi:hypothetical protein